MDPKDWQPGEGFGSDTMRDYVYAKATEANMTIEQYQKSPEVYYAPHLSTLMTAKGPLFYSGYTNEVLGPF